jgi:hypothetical protein
VKVSLKESGFKMAREIKEVASIRTDLKKYAENYEHIFGKKEEKKEDEPEKDCPKEDHP